MSFKKLKAKYCGSFLGLWWALILPLFLAAAINIVFSRVFKKDDPYFGLFLVSGLLPWFFFANSINDALNSFTGNTSEARQNIFPREIMPLSFVGADFMNFMIGFVVVLPLFFVFAPRSIYLLPVLCALLFFFLLFCCGVCLFISCLNVFFRDLTHIMSVGMMVWFWLTPVFYPVSRFDDGFYKLIFLNPLVPYITSFQKILYKGVMPQFTEISACFILSVLSFGLGYLYFLKNETELLKRL